MLQNIHLKTSNTYEDKENQKFKALLFESKLKEHFLFKVFPLRIEIEDFYFHEDQKRDYINGYIIMIFDFTVCGKCLHEELVTLKDFKEKAEQKNIFFLAIIGISDKSEESEIINLHRTGDIYFPCKVVNIEFLYKTFNLDMENFLDTPFYIYAAHTFKVLDIFKPRYLDTKEFNKWLTIITNQDTF